jgi:hypothetical protein
MAISANQIFKTNSNLPTHKETLMAYQELSTTKYWHASVKQEIKDIRRQKNQEAVRSFFMFAFTALVIAGVAYAVYTMSAWLPGIVEFMEYYGVIPPQINA